MSNWEKTHIDLNTIYISNKRFVRDIIFKALDNVPEILKIKTSCGCSEAIFNKENKELIVSFRPKKIPHHLIYRGWYETKKFITITYIDNTTETLSFKAKIIKN